MKKLFAGNGNPPPKDPPQPRRIPTEDVPEQDDAGNGNPPPPDKP